MARRYRGPEVWFERGDAPLPAAAYQPRLAPSYRESLSNIARPGLPDAAEVVAPTWTAPIGWGFTNTAGNKLTSVVPAGAFTVLVRLVYTSLSVTITGSLGTGNSRFYIVPNLSSGVTYAYAATSAVRTPAIAAGESVVLALVGTGTSAQPYRNGVADGAAITSTFSGVGAALGIGYGNGVSGTSINATMQAWAAWTQPLLPDQVRAITIGAMELKRWGYWRRRPTFWTGFQAAGLAHPVIGSGVIGSGVIGSRIVRGRTAA